MMKERILAAYDPFVLPFVFGMTFVLVYCLVALVKILIQLKPADRQKFALSLITPTTIAKNIRDLSATVSSTSSSGSATRCWAICTRASPSAGS